MQTKITVIGMGREGLEGLGQRARDAIAAADQLWGSAALLALFPDVSAPKTRIDRNIRTQLLQLANRGDNERVVMLGSGDPLFHGIASTLLRELPGEDLIILPQPSYLQEACALSGMSWEDMVFLSAHTGIGTDFLGRIRRSRKVGLLCGTAASGATPADIARRLIEAEMDDLTVSVCSDIGSADEAVFQGSLHECAERDFPQQSVMLLAHAPGWRPAAEGTCRPDDAYQHRNGLITKQDIRTLCFARLELAPDMTVWDIGAGSGAVSIEAAERVWRGSVVAFEKDPENVGYIHENQRRYAIDNLAVVHGVAPAVLADYPLPDAVFIGGSSGPAAILDALFSRREKPLKTVMTFTLLENLLETVTWCRAHGVSFSLIQAGIHESVLTGGGMRLVPKNPIFILEMML